LGLTPVRLTVLTVLIVTARSRDRAASLLPAKRVARNDWIHTGIVVRFDDETIETIEGNTNDTGSREGFEVVRRIRGYRSKDFVRLD